MGSEAKPDPRPAARVRLSRGDYTELRATFLTRDPWCACGCGRRAESLHHLIGGGGRSDVRENIVGLAGDGTRGCHGAITHGHRALNTFGDGYADPEAVRSGIRQTLETTRQDARRYVVALKGWDWLERHYPRRG